MYKLKHIQKLIAALLLAVFALAVCPRLFVHNIFANHIDVAKKTVGGQTSQINTTGYNCQCDDQVAESNFLGVSHPSIITLSQSHLFLNQLTVSFVSVSSLYIDLRGPPNKILIS